MSGEMSLSWLNKVLRSNDKKELSQVDYAKVYEELGKNDEDGIFTQAEFNEALSTVLSDEQMSAIEDGYNEAYSALANYDGEEDFTLADLDEMGDDAANEAAQKFEAANADNNYANSEEYSQRENSKPVALQNQTAEVAAVSQSGLGSKNVETLRSERAQISTDIENERAAMEEAKAEKQEAVNTAEGEYQNLLNEVSSFLSENEESLSEEEKQKKAEYDKQKEAMDNKNIQIDNQKNVITELQSGVDSQKNAVSSISAQLSYHVGQEPQQASYKKEVTKEDGTKETVDDTEAFEAEHKAWEQQKAELEANKQEAEDKLSDYEQQLGEAENALKVLEQEKQEIDSALKTALDNLQTLPTPEDGEVTFKELIENKKTALDTAKEQLQNVTQPYEANIAQMQLNLAEYDAAITQAESSLNLEGQDGVEKKGVFENKALDAVNTSRDPETLSRNSASLSDEEQEEYLKEYLGDAYEGVELIASGDDTPGYFSRKNEDGTTDCFKVVNDQGKISLIHTNIPKDGTAMTEVYGVEALKDENGDPREYPKYLTTKDGALQPGQIESLAEDIMESGSIPEDVDISTLSSQTLSSLIEKYGDGAKFANEIISTIDKDSQSDVLEKLDEIYNLRARRGYDNTDTQTNAARLALKKLLNPEDEDVSIEAIRQNSGSVAAGYLKQIEESISAYSADGAKFDEYDVYWEYDAIAKEILSNPDVTGEEAMALLSYLNSQSVNDKTVQDLFNENGAFFNNSYIKLMQNEYTRTGDIQSIIDMNEEYKQITGQQDTELVFGIYDENMDTPQQDMVDLVYSMYQNAKTPEEINALNEQFPSFPILLQNSVRDSAETQKMNELFSSVITNQGVDYSELYNEKAWYGYGNGNQKKAFKEIIKSSDNFNDPKNYIAALLWASDGDINTFTDYFRSLSAGDQEKYLPIILEAFSGKWPSDEG